MPTLRIKSSQRRLLGLLAFTFLVGTMITVVNYNQNLAQQPFVFSENDRTALLKSYFRYNHMKRNLIADPERLGRGHQSQASNHHSEHAPPVPQALRSSSLEFNSNAHDSSSQINQPSAPSISSPSNDQQAKVSSTTFSDGKESSTKFLVNRDNRDVNSREFQKEPEPERSSKPLSAEQIDKAIQISSSKKPVTAAPIQEKLLEKVQENNPEKGPEKVPEKVPEKIPEKVQNLTNAGNPPAQPPPVRLQQQLNKPTPIIIKPSPVYTHSEAELNLTRRFLIDKAGFCSKEHGYGLDLLVMVITSPANFEARNAIRQTWGGFAVERGSKLLFVVGRSPLTEINERLQRENAQYEDILQGQFQDAYYNLTLKSLAIVNWVADNCEKAKYVLKIDDDMFVNMQLLVDFAETREFKNVIIGKIAKKWLPHRDSNSKWYVPSSAYAGQVYPNFATGPAYLIHRDAIPNLARVIRSNTTKVIKLEDVFLAGIVAEKAGVRRLNYSLFKNAYFEVNKCNFMRFITSHQHSPKEIIRLWQLVYSDKKVDCAVKKPAVTKAPVVEKKAPPKLVQAPIVISPPRQTPVQVRRNDVRKTG